jgi:hypothetical protein
MVAGSLIVCTLVLGVLAAQGALAEFFTVVVQFNMIYATRFPLAQGTLDTLRAGFEHLSVTGLAVYGGLGFAAGVTLFFAARRKIPAKFVPLLGICAIALPIEIVLVTTTRRGFMHYYVVMFYALVVWTGWLFWLLRSALLTMIGPTNSAAIKRVTLGMACGVGILALPALDHNIQYAKRLRALEPPEVVRYMQEHTRPDETVLVFGLEPRLLLFAGRRAPTRFAHSVVFEHPRFVTDDLAESYFDDVLNNKPALIVDPREFGLNNFTPADSGRLRRQVERLRREYRPVGPVAGWMVYERNDRAH